MPRSPTDHPLSDLWRPVPRQVHQPGKAFNVIIIFAAEYPINQMFLNFINRNWHLRITYSLVFSVYDRKGDVLCNSKFYILNTELWEILTGISQICLTNVRETSLRPLSHYVRGCDSHFDDSLYTILDYEREERALHSRTELPCISQIHFSFPRVNCLLR